MEKILCIDDDPAILDCYYEEFCEEGYEVVLARNGEEALRKYESESPQLIIMDLNMQGMDGIAAMNAIREKDRQVLIIINSALPESREHLYDEAQAYVAKSSDLRELKQKVRDELALLCSVIASTE